MIPARTIIPSLRQWRQNKTKFTKRQVAGAEKASSLRESLIYPSDKNFKWIIQSNQIRNCPVRVQDIEVAHEIWGKDINNLKGKTTRKKPIPVAKDFVKIPREIQKLHKFVYLTADIFFVNKIPFMITLSCKICFTTVEHLANRKIEDIFRAFKVVFKIYLQAWLQGN